MALPPVFYAFSDYGLLFRFGCHAEVGIYSFPLQQ